VTTQSARAFTAALVESGRELSFRGATLYALPPHLAPAGGALYVQRVLEATPARAAGLREGDLVLELEGQPVPSAGIFEGLRGPLGQKPVALKVDAQGVPRTLRVSP
jgi:S1-C subfamily serine protease